MLTCNEPIAPRLTQGCPAGGSGPCRAHATVQQLPFLLCVLLAPASRRQSSAENSARFGRSNAIKLQGPAEICGRAFAASLDFRRRGASITDDTETTVQEGE